MRNERMYAELVELLKTDSASGRESAVAELLKKKLAEEQAMSRLASQSAKRDYFRGLFCRR